MSMCRILSCIVGRVFFLWHSFGKTLLALALLHFVLQGQIFLLLQVSLDFLLVYSRAQTKPCAHQDPEERSSDVIRDWARLACEGPGVSVEVWSTVACCEVKGTEYNSPGSHGTYWHESFEGGCHYHHYSHHSKGGREHSIPHQEKTGLKIYSSWPCPPDQGPVFPTASPSH